MKTFFTKLAIAVVPFIALATVIGISANISEKTLQYRTALQTQTQPGPEIFGSGYDAMMHNLYATSGR